MITIGKQDHGAVVRYEYGEHPLDIETLVIDESDPDSLECSYYDGWSDEALGTLIIYKNSMDYISTLTEEDEKNARAMLIHFLLNKGA